MVLASGSEEVRELAAEIEARAPLPPHVDAQAAIGAVMCTLTERLTAGEAYELLDAVPDHVRPIFERCVLHREGTPADRFGRAELVERVAVHLGVTPTHGEAICRAVFGALQRRLPSDLIAHVGAQLPRGLRELWLEPTPTSPKVTDPGAARNEVLEAIARADLPPEVDPAQAFAAVMCTVCQRLSGGEVQDVYLGLPATLRPLVAQCVLHRGEHAETFDRDELLRRIAAHLGVTDAQAEPVARAVFEAVKTVLPDKEIADVTSQLPQDLRDLWAAS